MMGFSMQYALTTKICADPTTSKRPYRYGLVDTDNCEPMFPSTLYKEPTAEQKKLMGFLPRDQVGLFVGLVLGGGAVSYRQRKKLQAQLLVRHSATVRALASPCATTA